MNVVSVALFGNLANTDKYRAYLPAAIRAHHNLYPGWSFRIHHDGAASEGPYAAALRALDERGFVELARVEDPFLPGHDPALGTPLGRGMLWRLLPLWDDRVERFVCRDIDTVPGYRERCAVEEWIQSGLAFHAMADKRGSHDFPTMGGMVGLHVQQMRPRLMNPLIPFNDFLKRAGWSGNHKVWTEEYRVSNWTSNNQLFLCEHVWKLAQDSTCEHRLAQSRVFEESKLSLTEIGVTDVDGVLPEIRQGSDALIPFIGSANISLDRAFDFYKEHGNPIIEQAISECEAA